MKAESLDLTLNGTNEYKFGKILQPRGIGAMTVTMLIALYQQAAPIIANKSLIKNVIDHQNLFADFVTLDRNSLYNKYSRYNRFKGYQTLDNFRTNYQYLSKSVGEINKMLSQVVKADGKTPIYQILHKIVTDKRFNLKCAPTGMQRLSQNNEAMNALILEMVNYTVCSWIDFEKDWQIKQVTEDIFLLIPNNYINTLNLKNKVYNIKTPPISPHFTQLELELGLKIDHLQNVNRTLFEQPIQQNLNDVTFVKSLEQIFITHDDIKKAGYNKPIKHLWSLYMAGHGHPKYLQIEVLPQLHQLKDLFKKKLDAPKFKNCLSYEKNKQQTQLNGLGTIDNHVYQCEHHGSYKKYSDKIKQINKEIKRIEPITRSTDKAAHGIISSLSVDEFRDVLKFLNDSIDTTFLYYTSCYAGGPHLIRPYTQTAHDNKPLLLNYTVISGTPAENMSLQEFPFINLPPYSNRGKSIVLAPSDIHTDDIDIPNKKLKLVTTLQFGQFFGALRKGIHNKKENLLLIPYSVHPHIDSTGKIEHERIANIPLVRFAHTDHFEPIPGDNSSVLLYSKNSSKPLVINKNATLIYTDYIPGKITLNKIGEYQHIPKLFSMIPGFAAHTFEEISSSTLSLKEVVNSFLTFPELGSSKIFWIKKLKCQNSGIYGLRTKIFNDVIIMRNVFNSNTLARCTQDGRPTILENCAYFSSNACNESKLTWNGPFLDDNNYRINICDQSNHKEECLNCFPKITSFLSPVLQSI